MPAIRPFLVLASIVVLAGCAAQPERRPPLAPVEGGRTVLRSLETGSALEDRLLALDPERVTTGDVADVLSKGPTPQILLLHGGVYPVHLAMTSFGSFLVAMGYPEAKVRPPAGDDWSYSPYTSTNRLAGIFAWHYEQDGLRPMIVGHSQGGLYAVKVLKALAGRYGDSIEVWNPLTDQAEPRTSIVDPLTDAMRPVVGLSASYASALGAGGWALVLPNQWDDFAALRAIPDTVDEFTGYFIDVDLFALSFPGNPLDVPYVANGKAAVRNVRLPAAYNHVMVPVTHALAENPEVRRWLDAYVPGREGAAGDPPEVAGGNVLWAADVWHSIKRHWVLEAQRLVRARRGLAAR